MQQFKEPLYRKYGPVLFILAFGLMICVYTVTNKIIVGISGVLVSGLFAWIFYEIRTSGAATQGAKRSSWFFLVVILCILYITYAKLTGTWSM